MTEFYNAQLPCRNTDFNYHIAGMFGGVNVWRIAKFKVVGEKILANGWISTMRIPIIS